MQHNTPSRAHTAAQDFSRSGFVVSLRKNLLRALDETPAFLQKTHPLVVVGDDNGDQTPKCFGDSSCSQGSSNDHSTRKKGIQNPSLLMIQPFGCAQQQESPEFPKAEESVTLREKGRLDSQISVDRFDEDSIPD